MYKVISKEHSLTSALFGYQENTNQTTAYRDALLSPSATLRSFFKEVFPLERT